MAKKHFILLCFCFLLVDSSVSYVKFYNSPLDGDMAESVLPLSYMKDTYNHPFGLKVFHDPTPYHNPNRYFSHFIFYQVYNVVPFGLQSFLSPVQSLYHTTAIVKWLNQYGLIFLIALIISGSWKIWNLRFMGAAVLLSLFFQTHGYRGAVGIIDLAPSYLFFYAFPTLLLLLFFAPFLMNYLHDRPNNHFNWIHLLLVFLAIPVCFSGPLNAGLVGSISIFLGIYLGRDLIHQKVSLKKYLKTLSKHPYTYLFIWMLLLSIFSFYVGTFNSYTQNEHIPILDRYGRLFQGLGSILSTKLAWPIIIIWTCVNIFYIRTLQVSKNRAKLLSVLKAIGFLSLIYILLLPWGGFRSYRPLIIRYDTFIPVSLMMFFWLSWSTIELYENTKQKLIRYYSIFIFIMAFSFWNADRKIPSLNACERETLEQIDSEEGEMITFPKDCKIISWDFIQTNEQRDQLSQLLRRWNIIEEHQTLNQ